MVMVLLSAVMAIAISCSNETAQPLSIENKALLYSVAENISSGSGSSSSPQIADVFLDYAEEDLNSALGKGIQAGKITVKGSITGIKNPVFDLDLTLADFGKISSLSIKTDKTKPSTDPYRTTVIAKDSRGDTISGMSLQNILGSDEFSFYVLDALRNVSINGNNMNVALNLDYSTGEGNLPQSIDVGVSVQIKKPMQIGSFAYSGLISVSLNEKFVIDQVNGGLMPVSMLVRIPFDLKIYDGLGTHSISGKLSMFGTKGSVEPDYSLSDFRIDGTLINGDEVLTYIKKIK